MFSREHKRKSEVKKGGGRVSLTAELKHPRLLAHASERLTSTCAQTRERMDAAFSAAAPTVEIFQDINSTLSRQPVFTVHTSEVTKSPGSTAFFLHRLAEQSHAFSRSEARTLVETYGKCSQRDKRCRGGQREARGPAAASLHLHLQHATSAWRPGRRSEGLIGLQRAKRWSVQQDLRRCWSDGRVTA